MVIIFRPNVLILINIFSNISKILGKIFCRHSTNVLCLLGISLLWQKGKFTLQPYPGKWLGRKMFGFNYNQRIKILCSSQKYLPVQKGLMFSGNCLSIRQAGQVLAKTLILSLMF